MPCTANITMAVVCPRCGFTLGFTGLSFAWGYCSSYGRATEDYQIGQPIRWRELNDGTIPAWTYFTDFMANIGDPSITSLIVTDAYSFTHTYCEKCGFDVAGAAVKIENGIITKAWLFAEGEFDKDIDIYLIEPNGTLTPEWFDHSMQFLNDDGTLTYPTGYIT